MLHGTCLDLHSLYSHCEGWVFPEFPGAVLVALAQAEHTLNAKTMF